MGARSTDVEPDVRDVDASGALASRLQDEAGLERRERHRFVSVHSVIAGFAGETVHTGGNVDRKYGCAAGIGRVIVATKPGAVSGVHDEIRSREPRTFGRRGVDHLDADA